MDDDTLAALCIWTEASGEMYEGKVAVGRVIRNRMAARYSSDGTVAGTVLAYDQFSDFYFEMVNGVYTRVGSTPQSAAARAEVLLATAEPETIWPKCIQAWTDSGPGSTFVGGPQYEKMDAQTLLYCNTAISHPAWAIPEKQVCIIGHHTFFHP